MNQINRFVDFAHLAAQAPGRAQISGTRYVDTAYMAREWETLWPKFWLIAGLSQDLPEPGDVMPFEIGPESILLTRGEDGVVHALYNACQHRGNRLITDGPTSVAHLQCPYHAWEYELDGTFKGAPDAHRFPQGLPCAQLSLKPLKVAEWAGMVWVNMDPDAAPLSEFLGEMIPQLDAYRIEDMVLVEDQTVQLDANWKTVIDNFSELYHVDYIHPQHASFVDCLNATVELFPLGHNRVLVPGATMNPRYDFPEDVPDLLKMQLEALGLDPADFHGRVADIRKAVQKQKREKGKALGYDYSHLSDDQLSDVWQYNIFPNIIGTIQAEEFWLMRARPHATDPNKCTFDKLTLKLFPRDMEGPVQSVSASAQATTPVQAGARPERDVFHYDRVIAGEKSMTITIDQDVHLLADVQRGMHSRGFEAAWLNEDESRVQHFHDWMDVFVAPES